MRYPKAEGGGAEGRRVTKRFGVNERMPDRKREGNILEASPFVKYSDHLVQIVGQYSAFVRTTSTELNVVKKGALGGLSAR